MIDMSIDEAIAKYKETTNTDAICPAHCNISCDKCVDESKQIVEWLEELKELRETSCGYSKEDIELNRNAMYNKAIDDFAEKLIRYVDCGHLCSPTEVRWSDLSVVEMVKELAEQLKAGEENEIN